MEICTIKQLKFCVNSKHNKEKKTGREETRKIIL